jgi:hypothetical protein
MLGESMRDRGPVETKSKCDRLIKRERKRGLMKGRSLVGRERETDDRIR